MMCGLLRELSESLLTHEWPWVTVPLAVADCPWLLGSIASAGGRATRPHSVSHQRGGGPRVALAGQFGLLVTGAMHVLHAHRRQRGVMVISQHRPTVTGTV